MTDRYFFFETQQGVIKGFKSEDVQAVVFYPKGTDVTSLNLAKQAKINSVDNKAILEEDWTIFRLKDTNVSFNTTINFYGKDARRVIEDFKIATGGKTGQVPA